MELYLYQTETGAVVAKIEDVRSYTDCQVVTDQGVYAPLAEGCELSALEDCSQTLRANWRERHPSAEQRLEELEAMMAELLFGGDAE